MGVSEVAYGDRTIMSITDSTVTEDTLADGAVAYGADGERIVGKMTMGLPVGHIYFSLEKTVPVGSLALNGGTYAHLAYIDLWNYILEQGNYLTFDEWQAMYDANDGNVPFYAITQSGSQSQWRFRVPSINGWVKGASSLEEVGSYLEAGLPNITGTASAFRAMNGYAHEYTGALYDAGGSSKSDQANTGAYSSNFGIDASLSSSVYGASDTVQPQSLVGMWLVQAFGTVSNAGNQDVADISAGLTDVENKLDAYVTSIDSYLVETWTSIDGLSWYRRYSNGWLEQGGRLPTISGTGQWMTCTMNAVFATNKYTLLLTPEYPNSTSGDNGGLNWIEKSTGSFTFVSNDDKVGNTLAGDWYACGMGAQN